MGAESDSGVGLPVRPLLDPVVDDLEVIKVILETKKMVWETQNVGSGVIRGCRIRFWGRFGCQPLQDPVVDDLEVNKVILQTKKCPRRPKVGS